MRGATVVLLALLTRALNPCCTSLSLGEAERQNDKSEHPEDRAIKVSRAFTFKTRHVPIECEGCLVEKYQSAHLLLLSVENPEAFTAQIIVSRCQIVCFCEIQNKQVMGEQHNLEPNLGLHKAFKQPLSHVNMLVLHSMNSFYLKNEKISASVWTIALHIMCELDFKNPTREMNCVYFNVHIFMADDDQMDKLCIKTGAWFMSANFNESNESHVLRLSILFTDVKLSEPAVKALIYSFLRQTDHWTTPALICVRTILRCKLVMPLHRSLNMISFVRGIFENCAYNHCAELYKFIWRGFLEKQREFDQMVKSCFRSNLLTCTNMWKHKENSPLHWQICTQLLSRGLFQRWIIRVMLITVSLFLIGQTIVVTYMSCTQRHLFPHRVRNSNLSFVLLFTISWCSLSPLSGQLTVCSCKLHNTAFGVTFVLSISCVLGKTIVVLMAFKATIPGSDVMKWFGRLPHRLSVLAFTMTEILVFVFWFSIHLYSFKLIMNCHQEKMILECNVPSVVGFCLSFYLLVLSFILNFLFCNLPFTNACYSVLNIHAVMGLTTRISLRALLR